MNTKKYMFLIFLVCAAASAHAVTCRSGDAAATGGQIGYQRDQLAAQQVEKNENISSNTIGKCISGMSSILVAPQFPSISGIFDLVKAKICAAANEKIHEVDADISQTYNSVVNGFNSSISVPGIPTTTTVPLTSTAIPQGSTSTVSSTASNFWSKIWK